MHALMVEDVPVETLVEIARMVMRQVPIYAIPIIVNGFIKAFPEIKLDQIN